MHVKRDTTEYGSHYYLAERYYESGKQKERRMVSYGTEPPTFTYPETHNGLCENYLPEIPDGEVDLLIDDPPYGTLHISVDCSDVAHRRVQGA